ncbi:DNA replication/repair protein RecF [Candidatus Chlorohelix sp.]|uniref:DNA replication/repair protein RecF n=1 Tax=Candidatus Chlorohelix sp. TaxID=3139201 RepID=UPI0030473D4C
MSSLCYNRRMYCTQLYLKDFRNYRKLDLSLSPGLSVFQGENAAGKTTLLEAIYMLATTKSARAGSDQELVNLAAEPQFGVPAFARLHAKVQRAEDELEAEIVITRDAPAGEELEQPAPARKRIKLNGSAKRAVDLIGKVNVVLFSPEDLDLVIGSPSLRRRYFDITLSQVDYRYLRCLQDYTKVLAQRNGYLRHYREKQKAQRLAGTLRQKEQLELSIWDEELIKAGSYIIKRRYECIQGLNRRAALLHSNLLGLLGASITPDFELVYQTSFELPQGVVENEGQIAAAFTTQLEKVRSQEFVRGVSLAGPHRDELCFLHEGKNLAVFGSRGQQRTAVLALKLAEAGWMEQQTEERPILLLDDILSELDAGRRQYVLDTVLAISQQVLITTTDLSLFGDAERLKKIAQLYKVEIGRVVRF